MRNIRAFATVAVLLRIALPAAAQDAILEPSQYRRSVLTEEDGLPSAVQGDREQCLAAGMDEYIAKPAEPGTLQAVLARAEASRLTAIAPDTGGTVALAAGGQA